MSKRRSTNLLALPKRKELWECFVAPEGRVIMREDINSLEPHVLTHMSQDKNLLSIYGKGASPHDIYLFVGTYFENHRDTILTRYKVDGSHSKEEVSAMKDDFKAIRNDIKPAYLGWCYGLGATTLAFDKQIPYEDAKKALRAIDNAFPGKDRLHNYLLEEWNKHKGFVVNGRGRPICVTEGVKEANGQRKGDKRKDLVNKVVQSTGHDILMRVLYHRWLYIRKHNIDAIPYIIDYHDESLAAVKEGHQEGYRDAVEYSYEKINEELDWTVVIRHGGISEGLNGSVRCD